MARSKTPKLNVTKNYRLFKRDSGENRVLNVKKHKRLRRSMEEYGFLASFPISCFRDESGQLVVKDGQHRLAFAEELGLPVYWIEETADFDVAKVNVSIVTWRPKDHAEKYAAQGIAAYAEGLEFAAVHSLPIGTAFSLLGGTTTFSNLSESFYAGEFVVKDRTWADAVAATYGPLVRLSRGIKNARFVEACMAVCRVEDFDIERLISNAERCRDKLCPYSTRDAYLEMLEEVYNFGRKNLVGLKIAATIVMRERSATNGRKAPSNRTHRNP